MSSTRFPPPATAAFVDADSAANVRRRAEVGLGLLPIPSPITISPDHLAASNRYFRALVDQGVRVANTSHGERFDERGRPVKMQKFYDGRPGWRPTRPKQMVLLPRVQVEEDPRTEDELVEDAQRREWVRRAFLHSRESECIPRVVAACQQTESQAD